MRKEINAVTPDIIVISPVLFVHIDRPYNRTAIMDRKTGNDFQRTHFSTVRIDRWTNAVFTSASIRKQLTMTTLQLDFVWLICFCIGGCATLRSAQINRDISFSLFESYLFLYLMSSHRLQFVYVENISNYLKAIGYVCKLRVGRLICSNTQKK